MTDLSGIDICSDSVVVSWNFYFPAVSVAWESPALFPTLVTVTSAGLQQLFRMYQVKAEVNSWWKILSFEMEFLLSSSNGNFISHLVCGVYLRTGAHCRSSQVLCDPYRTSLRALLPGLICI